MIPGGPIITLTTDFGNRGSYAGALRGVLLSRCPEARLVDITHEIPPYAPLEGSLVLREACPRFPAGTVHLAVVDPGVGGARRPLAVLWEGHAFVGPDNGLLTPFLTGSARAFRLHDSVALPDASPTFHGRDLFAPAAARLARGEPPERVGEEIRDALRIEVPRPRDDGGRLAGQILRVDRFGNLITNLERRDLEGRHGPLTVVIGRGTRVDGISRTYADGRPGDLLALFGSSGLLEIAVVRGSAAAALGAAEGDPVVLEGGT